MINTIKLIAIEDQKAVPYRKLSNHTINYYQNLESVKLQVSRCLRANASDNYCHVEKLLLNPNPDANNEMIELTQEYLDLVKQRKVQLESVTLTAIVTVSDKPMDSALRSQSPSVNRKSRATSPSVTKRMNINRNTNVISSPGQNRLRSTSPGVTRKIPITNNENLRNHANMKTETNLIWCDEHKIWREIPGISSPVPQMKSNYQVNADLDIKNKSTAENNLAERSIDASSARDTTGISPTVEVISIDLPQATTDAERDSMNHRSSSISASCFDEDSNPFATVIRNSILTSPGLRTPFKPFVEEQPLPSVPVEETVVACDNIDVHIQGEGMPSLADTTEEDCSEAIEFNDSHALEENNDVEVEFIDENQEDDGEDGHESDDGAVDEAADNDKEDFDHHHTIDELVGDAADCNMNEDDSSQVVTDDISTNDGDTLSPLPKSRLRIQRSDEDDDGSVKSSRMKPSFTTPQKKNPLASNDSLSTSKKNKVTRKPPVPKFSHTERKALSTAPSIVQAETEPILPEGQTAGEVARAFNKSMRSYGTTSKASVKSSPMPTRSRSNSNPRGSTAVKASTSKITSNDDLLKNVRKAALDMNGRPSIGTLTMQWEFMKSNFLKDNEDELEWLMIAKQPGAYANAHKKYCTHEDKYYKSLVDIDTYETKLNIMTTSHGKLLMDTLSTASQAHSTLTVLPNNTEALEQVLSAQTAFKSLYNDNKEAFSVYNEGTVKHIDAYMKEINKIRTGRLATYVEKAMKEEIAECKDKLKAYQEANENALKDMEKWSKREAQCNDYEDAMRQEERAWFEKEYDANVAALAAMRSYIPANISLLTFTELTNLYKSLNGIVPYELAVELQRNKALHWIVMHTEDIAYSNFLVGTSKQFFENIESFDIIELRALSVCIPEKFELDADGKKAAWRQRFMSRVRHLASQQNQEYVKGGWDKKEGKRAMVKLPALKPEQERRSVYYFKTYSQCLARVKQYDDKLSMLDKKKSLLDQANNEFIEAKKEYEIILAEMRDPEFKVIYGIEQLQQVKEIAKTDMQTAEKKKKKIQSEVNNLMTTIQNNPVSKDSFLTSMDEIQSFLQSKSISWQDSDLSPVLIDGVCPKDPEIVKVRGTVYGSVKSLSIEEEALARKEEMKRLKEAKEIIEPDELIETKTDEIIQTQINSPLRQFMTSNPIASLESSDEIITPTTSRKGSILDKTNPSMIAQLTKMLGGDHNNSNKPIEFRSSMKIMKKPSVELLANEEKPTIKIIDPSLITKKSNSKLLQKLLHGNSNSPKRRATSPVPLRKNGPALSLFDQIKAGKSKVSKKH